MKKLLTLVCLYHSLPAPRPLPRSATTIRPRGLPSPPWLAPRDVDEVWGACGHMGTAFSCPGN
jgi:hypothetical protein